MSQLPTPEVVGLPFQTSYGLYGFEDATDDVGLVDGSPATVKRSSALAAFADLEGFIRRRGAPLNLPEPSVVKGSMSCNFNSRKVQP